MESISCGFWYTKTADHHRAMEPPVTGVTMYLHYHGYCLCQVTYSLSTSDGNGKHAFRINENISCGHVVAKLLETEYQCSWLVFCHSGTNIVVVPQSASNECLMESEYLISVSLSVSCLGLVVRTSQNHLHSNNYNKFYISTGMHFT